MIPSLENILCGTPEAKQAMIEDCTDIFSSAAGQRVLAKLCSVCHPLDHSPLPAELSATDRGRKEVVALLWRYSATNPQSIATPSP